MRPATSRPSTSVGPPAANGMTIVIAWLGKLSALAAAANASVAAAASAAASLIFMGVPPLPRLLACRHLKVNLTVRRNAVASGERLTEFRQFFREVVQALAGAVRPDQVIVAVPRQHTAFEIGRMDDDVHVDLDIHRLVAADERPLDEIVALAVAMQTLFFRPAVLAHEIVVGCEHILASGAWLEQAQVVFAGFEREGVF